MKRIKKKKKILGMLCLTVFVILGSTASVQAEEEIPAVTATPIPSPTPEIKNGLKYEKKHYIFYENGVSVKNSWKTIKGHRYYFQSNGYAAVGPVKINGQYYVFNEKGCLLTPKKTSAVKVNKVYYYISPKGKPVPGYHLISGKLYSVAQNGKCTLKEGKGWKTISGHKYYFKSNGKPAVGSVKINGQYYVFNEQGYLLTPGSTSVVKANNRYYYVTPQGKPVPGWNIVPGKLYYVYENGECARNKTIQKVRFGSSAAAVNDVHSQLKIKCLNVISKVTTPSMTRDQKLRKCWYYVNTIKFQPWKYPDMNKKDWPLEIALDLLNTMGGNCFGFANAFAALAQTLGYEPYVIAIPKCHCWVRINGLYWDNMGNKMGTTYSTFSYTKDQIFKF